MIIPHRVDGGAVTAGLGLIHHVVVDKRGVVKQLHSRCCRKYGVGNRPEQLGTEHHYDGADELALALQIVLDYLVHQFVR